MIANNSDIPADSAKVVPGCHLTGATEQRSQEHPFQLRAGRTGTNSKPKQKVLAHSEQVGRALLLPDTWQHGENCDCGEQGEIPRKTAMSM